MNPHASYESLLRKLDEERKAQISKIDEEYRINRAALERLKPFIDKANEQKEHVSSLHSVIRILNEQENDLNSKVQEAVRKHVGGADFTRGDVEEALKTLYPKSIFHRSTVHNGINKMLDSGEVSIFQQGEGRRPTIFRKAQNKV